MPRTVEQHESIYEGGQLGLTERGIYFGLWVVLGLYWPIPQTEGEEEVAGVALFRGEAQVSAIDYNAPVGIGLGKPAVVRSFQGVPHQADTWYVYDARPFNGMGVVGEGLIEPRRVLTDSSGDVIDPPVPNPPSYVSVSPIAGGKARVTVGYSSDGQAVEPTDVAVYGKAVSDPANPDTTGLWTTPLTDDVTGLQYAAWRGGQRRLVFNVAPQTDGEFWIFGAALRNAGGALAINTVVSNVIQMASVPPPATDDWSVAHVP